MQNTLNILIVHNEYQFAGGEDTVVAQDAAMLERRGHHVFLYKKNNDALKHMTALQKLKLPFTTFFSLESYREIKKLIRAHQIDIVHVHNTLPLISYSAYYAAHRMGCGLVQTVHNFRLVCPNALLYRDGHICEDCLHKTLFCSVRYKCYRGSAAQTAAVAASTQLHRLLGTFRKPDAYLTLTGFNKDKIVRAVPGRKVYVKPNFLSPSSPCREETPNGLMPSAYYLYASRLEAVKGVFVLLEAFRRMPGETLVLLGTGPDEEKAKAYVKTHSMKNVHFLGFTEHEKALSYLKNAKALVFPSLWYEGFPMTIVESLSVSTPVIASDTPNLAETVRTGENGWLFQTGNASSLQDAVETCSGLSHEKMDHMRHNCFAAYESRFTEERIYARLMEIYFTIL